MSGAALSHECSDESPSLEAILGALPALYQIDLRGTSLGPEGAARIATAAARSELRLTSVDLRDNQLGDAGVCHVAKVVLTVHGAANGAVRILDLGWNRIGPTGAVSLADMLVARSCALTLLDLECNDLADEGAICLARALPQCSTLQTLRLGGNRIAVAGGKSIAAEVLRAPSLEKLDISRNYLGPRGAEAFAEALGLPTPGREDATRGVSVGRMKTFCSLHVAVNRIRDEGAKAFAAVLGQGSKCCGHALDVLDLGANQIGDIGARALAGALSEGRSCLRWLGLGHNKLSAEGGALLAEAFEVGRNHHMQTVQLIGNEVGHEAPGRISIALRRNCRSIMLFDPLHAASELISSGAYAVDLKGVMVGVDGARPLASALLSRRVRLQELILGNAGLGDAGTSQVVAALARGLARVTHVDLSWNRIGPSAAEQLGEFLRSSGGCSLTSLDLDCNDLKNEGVAKLVSGFDFQDPVLDAADHTNDKRGSPRTRNFVGHPLRELRLASNSIGPLGVSYLVASFGRGLQLVNLHLGRNVIGRVGAEYLAKLLRQPGCSLCELDLSVNRLGDAGHRSLYGRCLCDLNLNSNFIGDDGAASLAKALGVRAAVRLEQVEFSTLHLHLEYNKITPIGGAALSAALRASQAEVSLAHNPLSSAMDGKSPRCQDSAGISKRQRYS